MPQLLLLSEQLEQPLTHARIGWETYTFDLDATDVVVSSETADGPRDAPLRPETVQFWEPSSLPATFDIDLGTLRELDYVGLVGNFGSVGVAVEVRISEDVDDFNDYLSIAGGDGNYASTPDTVANSITGDLHIELELAITELDPPGSPDRALVSKWIEAGDQRSWALLLTPDQELLLRVSTDGASGGIREFESDPLSYLEDVRFRVRVKLDLSAGGPAESVCTFETSDDDGATWDPVGSPVTDTPVAGIHDGTAPVDLCGINGGTSDLQGKIFQFWLYANTGSTVVAHFNAGDAETGDLTVVSDATGETWTINRTGPQTALKIKRFSSPAAPADDAPLLFLDELRQARRVRLRLTGSYDAALPPRLAVCYVGPVLAAEREVDGAGFAPLTLSRETELTQPLSRGGQFLGQSYKRFGVKGSASFRHLDPTWYRANFDPFVRHARAYPFFFAWWPGQYPEEVGFVWADQDIAPSYMGVREWMQVTLNMHGVGND